MGALCREKLDLLFHSPFSPFTPLRRREATSEWLCVSDGVYKHRRSLQMAKINMRVLLKDMFTQTICSAPEIMNRWRFYWNNWKDFFLFISAYAIIEWHQRRLSAIFRGISVPGSFLWVDYFILSLLYTCFCKKLSFITAIPESCLISQEKFSSQ